MSAIGYIQVHAYTSDAQIPQKNVAVTITDLSGSALAMRLTNRNGAFDQPVTLNAPDRDASQIPGAEIQPFTSVNLYARLENYETIEIEDLQVFPGVLTIQNLELIPLSELPDSWNRLEIFITPPQNL